MAQKTTVHMIDDLTKEEGDNVETVPFALDGMEFTVDLDETNASELRDFLSTYMEAGQRVGGRRTSARRASGSAAKMDREQSQAIRVWGRSNGWPNLKDRGRVPNEVVEAYNAGRRAA